jgi:uncharacterized protein (TIGR02996 family)
MEAATMDRQGALLQGLLEAPEDAEAYAVYADALQAAGDAQGELIALQLRRERCPYDQRVRKAERALWKRAQKELLGELFAQLTPDPLCGYAEDLDENVSVKLDWRRGFIEAVQLRAHDYPALLARVETLLALPVAWLLRELRVLFCYDPEYRPPAAITLEERLAAHGLPLLAPPRVGYYFDELDEALERPERAFVLSLDGLRLDHEATLSALTSLPELEELYLQSSATQRVPLELTRLTRLRRLHLGYNRALTEVPSEVLALPTLERVDLMGCPLPREFHHGQLRQLYKGFRRRQTAGPQRRVEVDLMLGRPVEASLEQLLEALESSLAVVRERALGALDQQLACGDRPPRGPTRLSLEGAKVALVGRFRRDKKWLRGELERAGAEVLSRISGKATHLLVGDRGGEVALQRLAEAPQTTLVTEKALVGELADAPVEPASELDREALAAALLSRDDARAEEALSTLGGAVRLAETLLLDLLLLCQDTLPAQRVRSRAKKLFQLVAPAQLQQAVSDHLGVSILQMRMGERLRTERIDRFCAATGARGGVSPQISGARGGVSPQISGAFEPLEFATRLFERCGMGLAVLMRDAEPAALSAALRRRVRDDGHLSLWWLELSELPGELAELQGVRSLRLGNNRLRRFPEPVLALTRLEELDLSVNELSELPEELASLTQLRKLRLGHNRFSRFPAVLTQLSELRELDLCAGYNFGSARLQNLPGDLDALQDLEVLGLARAELSFLPAALFDLGQLRVLDLAQARLPEAIPPELARLTSLERLVVSYSSWAGRDDELAELLPHARFA